jgi:hypothetical protein
MSGFAQVINDAIYTALTDDVDLSAKVGSRIYDDAPQNTAFPYIVIGDVTTIEENTDDFFRRLVTVSIHTWSRYRGRKETREIQDLIQRALDRQNLTLTDDDYDLINIYETGTQEFLDADGLTRHGVSDFKIILRRT